MKTSTTVQLRRLRRLRRASKAVFILVSFIEDLEPLVKPDSRTALSLLRVNLVALRAKIQTEYDFLSNLKIDSDVKKTK